MAGVYETNTPSLHTFRNGHLFFKRGHTSLEDDPREGRPRSCQTNANINAVLQLVRQDRCIHIRMIEETLEIFHGTIVSVLHDELQMKKVSAWWVTKLLGDENKMERVDIAISDVLLRYNAKPADFEKCLVTGSESWC